MSYFDEEKKDGEQLTPLQQRLAEDETRMTKPKPHKKEKSSIGYFFSALIGVMIGALLVWFMMPSMIDDIDTNTQTNATPTQNVAQTATSVTSDITTAVEKASPAVVGISNYQQAKSSLGGFGFWFGQGEQEQGEGELQEAGTGSGVIYKINGKEAYIVTNYHVIEDAQKLDITLADGTKKEAKLVGGDVWTDLAVIKVDAEGIETVANFGDSDTLKQGEPAIAIGNPLGFDFYGSVTTGVISGTERSVPVDLDGDGSEDWESEVLQTDAAINGGNSGGALVNIHGDLIGINSMKIADESVEGLGFAIPINTVIPIIEQLEQNGKVERPQMGISLMDLTEVPSFYQQETLKLPEDVTTGVVVTDVVANSAAQQAGMQKYDVIVELDGEKVESVIDLRQHLYTNKKIGDTMNVKVYRAGKIVDVTMNLTAGQTF
ncbi:MAG: trypsin-like peptidase domain-containing protein [Caryophanon sp.]|nr:trypsin-like peptidase domain-containing protein [Caryophanon sp.]